MNRLANKRILMGVTGSIAAYKSADLVRRLRDSGAEVQVVMTKAAQEFITALTLQALSDRPVRLELMDIDAESSMGHISLARWADIVVIAPASADFIAKLAHGRADDLLSTLCLASAVPIAIAPAMNQQMWNNPATQQNIKTLLDRHVEVMGPAPGEQACGETGLGRLLEPEQIIHSIAGHFNTQLLDGTHVLVSAGPTYEDIDPVRYIGNRSSGKMGYAIADAAAEAGATVTLVSGPVELNSQYDINRIDVRSSAQMLQKIQSNVANNDIFFSVAAVADYTPVNYAGNKIKKDADILHVPLQRTEDILARVASLSNAPFTIGFCAETENLETNARTKLRAKNIDMIAANRVGLVDSGFDSDENEITLYWQGGEIDLPRAYKSRLARDMMPIIAQRYHQKKSVHENNRA